MNVLHPAVLTAALCVALPAAAQSQPAPKAAAPKAASGPTATDMEILKQKLKADKKLIVSENMALGEAEAKAFWPVYDEYQKGLGALNERTKKGITTYADAWNKGTVPDELAKKLVEEMISIEEGEAKLKRSVLPKLEKAVGSVKAARYLQIESKIRALIKMELAAAIPLA